jgi:ribosome-associated protein
MAYNTDRARLENEVRVETYRAGGPGGQHRNVTESAVRLTHGPSGVVVVAADSRSQHRNKEKAFERLARRLMTLNRVPARRIPTNRTRAAKERALAEKKRRQKTKDSRKRISADDM